MRPDKPRLKGLSYHARNLYLKELGYPSYSAYLKPESWRAKRRRVFAKRKGLYELCRDRGEQVHHYTYTVQNLGTPSTAGLRLPCETCHTEIEFGSNSEQVEHSRCADPPLEEADEGSTPLQEGGQPWTDCQRRWTHSSRRKKRGAVERHSRVI